jgi:hypothetical protein
MKLLYKFQSKIGPFYIGERNNLYYPVFDGSNLGGYDSPDQAADGLACNRTYGIRGIDTSTLGIPRDLGKWDRV